MTLILAVAAGTGPRVRSNVDGEVAENVLAVDVDGAREFPVARADEAVTATLEATEDARPDARIAGDEVLAELDVEADGIPLRPAERALRTAAVEFDAAVI